MTTTTKAVFAETSEDGKFIEIYFKPNAILVETMHQLRARFMAKDKVPEGQQPHWRLALDFFAAKDLTDKVGQDNIELGTALAEWAWSVRDMEKTIGEILKAEDWDLKRLPKALPQLHKWLRPYQRVAVAYMATVENPLCADQPGLGKTVESIGAIYEAGTEDGPNLVIAPKTSLESVWEDELLKWQKLPVIRASGSGLGDAREHFIHEAELATEAGRPFWLIVNPEMVRYQKHNAKMEAVQDNLFSRYPFLHENEWANIIIDEVHRNAVRNVQSVTAKGMLSLKLRAGGKKIGLSGTPVGGKPINLFGILHWLYPEQFPSKYKWAERWLEMDRNQYGTVVGDVVEEKQEEFDRHLMPIMIRRTKEQVLKELPPKDRHDLWVSMSEDQAEQYMKFAKMAEIELGDETLTATSILAIYTRLKQFASAKQRFEDGVLIPTDESPKLELLVEKLDEMGIMDGSSDAQVLVTSQFEKMARMVYNHLKEKGVAVTLLVGGTKDRAEVTRSFQQSDTRVVVMTTATGGVSITLDRADTVFVLDETWNPDDQEQVEDRAHRVSRIHQVTVYYLRTRNTIEEYIFAITQGKTRINKRILDNRSLRLY
jgi:SNF2 family DNA or RNA helicase